MVYHPDDATTSPEEDTEYADIYIPVPYDPEIPGVRCVDAEEVENVDVAMVNIAFDGEKTEEEVFELQDLQPPEDDIDKLCSETVAAAVEADLS